MTARQLVTHLIPKIASINGQRLIPDRADVDDIIGMAQSRNLRTN